MSLAANGLDAFPRALAPGPIVEAAARAPNSAVERFWTADEAVAARVETQGTVGRLREADPGAGSNFGGVSVPRDPQRPRAAQVDAVQPKIDVESGGKTAWSARQIAKGLHPPIALHRRDAL